VLFGHVLLDRAQYDTLATVTELLQRVPPAWGGRDGSLNGLWEAITGALRARASPQPGRDDPPATLIAKSPRSPFGAARLETLRLTAGTGKMPIGILKAAPVGRWLNLPVWCWRNRRGLN
jgi:hypothetical protein